MIQPLVELYRGCMVVLKVSWAGRPEPEVGDAVAHAAGAAHQALERAALHVALARKLLGWPNRCKLAGAFL